MSRGLGDVYKRQALHCMLQHRKACMELLQSGEAGGLLPDGYIPEDIVLRRILAAENYYDDISEGELMANWC